MTYGHSSGLPPWEAPDMSAEKHKGFFSFYILNGTAAASTNATETTAEPALQSCHCYNHNNDNLQAFQLIVLARSLLQTPPMV